MQHVMEDILKSTRQRVMALDTAKKLVDNRTLQSRDILYAIDIAKKKSRVPIIAEVKPASPTAAFRDISPQEATYIAEDMERGGAVAISVLTEPKFFHGSIESLKSVRKSVTIPILRKDFIIDESQMDEVKSDLILLIAALLEEQLEYFVTLAYSKGFEPLVEVHNEDEMKIALKTTARIIGINNRNLKTLDVDLLTTERLAPLIKEFDLVNGTEHIIISESGVHSRDDVKRVLSSGADAILIGTEIIKSNDVYSKTKELVESLK
ncbi:MAG: indole-3-glycerol-phosphate synthase [Methanosarcinaceae archaeon]|nr:indole-3-glycerol-phosphate synthase [Methanosarcinaceae archaeon]